MGHDPRKTGQDQGLHQVPQKNQKEHRKKDHQIYQYKIYSQKINQIKNLPNLGGGFNFLSYRQNPKHFSETA